MRGRLPGVWCALSGIKEQWLWLLKREVSCEISHYFQPIWTVDILSPWYLKQTPVPFYYCVYVWCKLYSLVLTGSRKLRLNAEYSCDRCHSVCSWLSLCCRVTVFDSSYVTSLTAACPKFSTQLHKGSQQHMVMGKNLCVSFMLEFIFWAFFIISEHKIVPIFKLGLQKLWPSSPGSQEPLSLIF